MSQIARYSPAEMIDLLDRLRVMGESNLEDALENLCRVGKPRVSRMDDGWVCAVDMHVSAAGTEFKIRSEFDCGTPFEAAQQCTERVVATLRQWA
jgi:hypothetical protein